ncbi:ABC transporter ATP-binding protein [Ornithinimicrobium cerasi]|uniref:ABC-type bacteriocin/lantibiotic exporter, contains an N-terminal double-glycine peptidase domain n=1 Tax=Ornithinimicrobium cerasi TaxID=2248773 RepID=A0A285VUV1_9MICO|nr:ABC transporter ATP-binding protein [Ornithinimicrobium cerasi]SOC57812.1 ABC-type bacteriocin/lantibiotic exporter, contains an N-terminal double-glycine peptidase domain [Ornithinimicrobium cerasi]
MRELVRLARAVLPRRVKVTLLLASLGLVLIAALDMVAIALVYPLVTLATGETPRIPVLSAITSASGITSRESLLIVLAIAVVVLFTAKSLAGIAFNWWLGGFTNRNRAVLSTRILRSYLYRPFEEVSRRSTAELIRTQQDAVNQFFLSGIYSFMTGLSNLATVVGITTVLFLTAPVPTLVLIAYFAFTGALYSRFVKRPATRAGAAAMASAGRTWRTALTALGGLKEIQLRGAQETFVDRYRSAVHDAAQANRVSGFLGGLPRHVLEVLFVAAIGIAVVMTSTTTPSSEASRTVGLLGAFVAAGFRILPALNGLLGNITSIQASREGTRLVSAELTGREAVPPANEGSSLTYARSLVLQDIVFSYPGSLRPTLTGINLTIPSGATVAFVGSSGAGKTTLIDLILGFHRPQSGSVTADGVDIYSDIEAWRRQVGYVPQDVFIIDGTLEENVYFDRPYADSQRHKEALGRVLRQADLADFVSSLPDGITTQMGERGSRLSGGQRQRIGLARALYRGPELLVLDEATSALDNVTESRIAEIIRDMGDAVTTLIVAHRLSTVKHADVIVLLDQGRIVGVGNFQELQGQNESFAAMVRLGNLT